MVTAPDADRVCLGRFSFALPQGWLVSGRDQRIYFSRVTDDLRSLGRALPGVSPVQRVLRGDAPGSEPPLREFTLDGVGPAAWYAVGGVHSPNRRLAVLAGSPESGLRLEAMATTGREGQAEQGLRQLAAGYRAGARTGFCLPHGAIVLDPSRSESTRLTALNPRVHGAELRFSTVTTATPRSDGPLADPAADAQAMAGTGTTLTPISKTERRVAGLAGHDARALLKEPNKEPTLIYRFFHPGTANSATAPEIIAALDGPAGRQAELDAAWDQLLDSVRPVPLR